MTPELIVACKCYKAGFTFVYTSRLDQIVGSAQIKHLLRNVAPPTVLLQQGQGEEATGT